MAFIDMMYKYRYPLTIDKTDHYKKVMVHLDKYPKMVKKPKNELEFFYMDIYHHSLLNKEDIDDIFRIFYLENQNILNRLNYQEKKNILIQEINQHIESFKSFTFNDINIYIPFFDEQTNKMYLYDRPLLELRQYRVFIDDFYSYMENPWMKYKSEIFKSDFSILDYIKEDERFICLYYQPLGCVYILDKEMFEIKTRLYIIDKYSSLDALSLIQVKIAVEYYLNYQFKECLDFLYQNHAISDKVYKKILKKYK